MLKKFKFGLGLGTAWLWLAAEAWGAPAQIAETTVNESFRNMQAAAGGPVEMVRSPHTGLATFLSTVPGKPIPTGLAANSSAEERGRRFLGAYGKAFGVSALDFVEIDAARPAARDDLGMEHVRFRQANQGIPVRGGEVIVHLRGSNVVAVSSKTIPDVKATPTVPAISNRAAATEALNLLKKRGKVNGVKLTQPRLEIFNRGLFEGRPAPTRLAWYIEATRIDLRESIWVDAQRGVILLHFNQITDAKTRRIYDGGSTSTLPGTLVRSEGGAATGDSDTDKAYDYSGDTFDYFLNQHGRNSYDNKGAPLISTVHYCSDDILFSCPYENAFWNGTQMVYGDGFAAADDVDAHELTHAVTEKSAGLVYYMQSGALNESMSDIFGETVDLTNNKGTDTAAVRWDLAEDLPSIGAFRNMMNPAKFSDPEKVSDLSFICNDPSNDNGGVHSNSGVPNHAFALMVDGGSYNGQTISAIGLTKAAKIEYRTLTSYLLSTSDFQGYYAAMLQSCKDLTGTLGITAADCTQVQKALDAVEMNSSECSPPDTPPVCPIGQQPTNVFFDDLENTASGKWANPVATGVNHWNNCTGTPDIYCDSNPVSGSYGFGGGDLGSVGDSSVAMTQSVRIPSGTARMQFAHAFGFETDTTTFYDGGVIEYSTDAGTTWTDAGSLIIGGAGYGGALSNCCGNPLTGRSAFVGNSVGFTTSQLNVSSLAGKDVRFRFRIGTDRATSDIGWEIDDIRIYSCATPIVLSINDVSKAEGAAGTVPFAFAVKLNPAVTKPVTVGYATANGTAIAGSDYTAASGTLTFNPGETAKTVTVNVAGDAAWEPNETFSVKLSGAVGATIGDNQGIGTIINDDQRLAADFTVGSVILTPANPLAGGMFSAAVTVKNQGTAAGDGGFLDVWSNQSVQQTCGATGEAYAAVGTLAAGQTKTFTLTGLRSGAAGAKKFQAFVDSTYATGESNEANNRSVVAYTTAAAAGADFVVTGVTLSPLSPKAGSGFTATVTVKNQGTVAGNAGFLDVWVNQKTTQSCQAVGDAYATVGTLTAGQSKAITVLGLPAVTAGANALRAFIDSSCSATEQIEANNQFSLNYTIVP